MTNIINQGNFITQMILTENKVNNIKPDFSSYCCVHLQWWWFMLWWVFKEHITHRGKFVSISRKPKFKPPVIEIYGRFGMRSFSSFLWEHTGYFDFVLSCFQDACREEIHLMKIYYFFIMVKLLNDTIYSRYIL